MQAGHPLRCLLKKRCIYRLYTVVHRYSRDQMHVLDLPDLLGYISSVGRPGMRTGKWSEP